MTTETGAISVLDACLGEVLRIDGVRAAVLIDPATGMIICSAGELNARLAEAADSMADEIRAVMNATGSQLGGDGLEEISVLTQRRCHLLEVIELSAGGSLVLFVEVDRAMSNVALAGWHIRQLLPTLLG
jgi:hypothetical protein